MKYLDVILSILLLTILIGMCLDDVSLKTNGVQPKFEVGNMVKVLPDSTVAIIESDLIVTDKGEKINGVRTRAIFIEVYTIVYTDKNGVIQRLKNISPEILVKIK